nr:MAG TPA: hypothetical protein [Bacteriophage sp.]DAV79638.1 MAG TPA: hypothetical protein [Bacteriophage sp.]DAV95035.1 MAG TPA: hypothetical protein [Bacteriophage sp.]
MQQSATFLQRRYRVRDRDRVYSLLLYLYIKGLKYSIYKAYRCIVSV